MQANGETQGPMPSLNDIISSGNNQDPNQVSYSYSRTVQQEGNPPSSTTTTNIREEPNSTTKVVRKIVTSQQPTTESTSYYSKKVTTKTTTTTTTTRGNQGPSTQTNTRYSNVASSGGNRNQSSSTYTRPTPQATKTTTTTNTRGQYGQPSSQVYRGNQNKISTQPKVIGNSQSFAGNKYQPKRPEQPQSYKPKARSPEPGSIKRKTINRGNPVENVQITHIIFTSGPADFHITENLNLDNLNSAPIQISKADRAKLQKSGKVSATCSCDGVEIAQPKKVNLKGNTTHYQHARGIGMTNDRKENINPMFYSSEIKKLDPIYKQKDKEKIENVESFRSSGKIYNNQPSANKTTTKTSTYNRNSNYKPNQNYSRGGATSSSNRGGMSSSISNRGGSSNVNNRGGMGGSIKTTTTVYRGSNMGAGGDGEIIKETNTKVSMGSRSNKNQSQPTVTTSHERKVYNQKNFFNK